MNSCISETNAHEALRGLGCIQDATAALQAKTMEILNRGKGVDHVAFMRMARMYDDAVRRSFRENDGYSQEELRHLTAKFELFDTNGSGDVDNRELMNLIKATYPAMASDPKMRAKLDVIMKESDENGNGTLDFQEFLRLVRAVSDLYSRIQLLNERRVIKQTGFSSHEVYEFRELFLANADMYGAICFEDFKQMINAIIPLSLRNLQSLSDMWEKEKCPLLEDELGEGTNDRAEDERSSKTKDFADFLWIMRKILDTNFGGVLERTGRRTLVEATDAEESRRTAQRG
jgi:Ca2+-binding EF-hand superfamily protein